MATSTEKSKVTETPESNAPKEETPKVETPKAPETPKTETPKAEKEKPAAASKAPADEVKEAKAASKASERKILCRPLEDHDCEIGHLKVRLTKGVPQELPVEAANVLQTAGVVIILV